MYVSGVHTPEQLEQLALQTYINDLGDQLAQDNLDYIIERSPSPPPEYDRFGKQTNTKTQRIKEKLEMERTLAVHKALELIPNYDPPANFSRFVKCTKKYFLPVREHPQINFIGLLLGPRGKNLRQMELKAGAKISIRGRGSVKEGSRQNANEEDLHCLVSSTSQQGITQAFKLIDEIVQTAIEKPDMNDFKRMQLRELAQLNGTFRDDEGGVREFLTKVARVSSENSELGQGISPSRPPGCDNFVNMALAGPPPVWP